MGFAQRGQTKGFPLAEEFVAGCVEADGLRSGRRVSRTGAGSFSPSQRQFLTFWIALTFAAGSFSPLVDASDQATTPREG